MPKARILIVEDSYIVAFHLQKTLEGEGYTVLGTETSGEGALRALEQEAADLVLMDIMLEGDLDGIETAGIIQEKHHIPVIYITALTDRDTVHRAKVTEPFGYLTKPFEDREIFTVIEMALYKHQVESKLRRSEERYFSTVRSISDAAIIFDHDFQITYLNPSAASLIGWENDEAQGKSVLEILKLHDGTFHEVPVNPIQCKIDSTHINTMPDGLVLISRDERQVPIGDGSISPILDYKNQLIGLIVIFKDITDRVARENLQKDLERQKLMAMMEGQENERSRIAKDLHDGLGQMLNAIKMNIKLFVDNNEQTKNLFVSIDETIQETVRISENLLPAKLRDFDLITCLKSLCNQLQRSSTMTITYESFEFDAIISQTQKVNFFRIAQEALNNAIKHSGGNSVSVQLCQEGDKLQLFVEDDGHGFENATTGGTFESMKHGLINMRDRAEIMGGKLTVESDTNRGTLVILEVPINKIIAHAEV